MPPCTCAIKANIRRGGETLELDGKSVKEAKTELAAGMFLSSERKTRNHSFFSSGAVASGTMSGGCLRSNNQIHLQANTSRVGTTIVGENNAAKGRCGL